MSTPEKLNKAALVDHLRNTWHPTANGTQTRHIMSHKEMMGWTKDELERAHIEAHQEAEVKS